jgi:pimeloyl-ACP methyl ester carboxylesterase
MLRTKFSLAVAQALALALLLGSATPIAATDAARTGRAHDGWARLDGARVHYQELGRGEPALVFVHGWAGDVNVWREQAAYFSRKHHVLLIDLPGFGTSDKPESAPYSMPYFARAVQAVMDSAHVKRAVLVGHSMGTPVIREVFRQSPQRVAGLVAVDGALRSRVAPEAGQRMVGPIRADEYRANVSKMLNGMMSVAAPAVRDQVTTAAGLASQPALVRALEGMFLDAAIWRDDKITVPLLVLNAKASGWNADYEEYVKSLAPDTTYETFDSVDHFLMLEAPQQVNARLERWLVAKKNGN